MKKSKIKTAARKFKRKPKTSEKEKYFNKAIFYKTNTTFLAIKNLTEAKYVYQEEKQLKVLDYHLQAEFWQDFFKRVLKDKNYQIVDMKALLTHSDEVIREVAKTL